MSDFLGEESKLIDLERRVNKMEQGTTAPKTDNRDSTSPSPVNKIGIAGQDLRAGVGVYRSSTDKKFYRISSSDNLSQYAGVTINPVPKGQQCVVGYNGKVRINQGDYRSNSPLYVDSSGNLSNNKSSVEWIEVGQSLNTKEINLTGAVGVTPLNTTTIKAELIKLYDTDKSNLLSLKWNENDFADRQLSIGMGTGDRTVDFSGSLYVEADSRINQDVTNDADVGFANIFLGDDAADGVLTGSQDLTLKTATNGTINIIAGDGTPSLLNIDFDTCTMDGDIVQITANHGSNISQFTAVAGLNLGSASGDIAIIGQNGLNVTHGTVSTFSKKILVTNSDADGISVLNNTLSTTDEYDGIHVEFTKTAGATDESDGFYGIKSYPTINDTGATMGELVGLDFIAKLTDGNVGSVGTNKFAVGLQGAVDLDGGKVWGPVLGGSFVVDQEAGNEVTGTIKGLNVDVDADGTTGGIVYMLYLNEGSNVGFGIFQNGTAPNQLGGLLAAAADTDVINIMGRVKIGKVANTLADYAGTSHYDHNTTTNFCTLQGPNGSSWLNCASGRDIHISIAAADVITVNASGVNFNSNALTGVASLANGGSGISIASDQLLLGNGSVGAPSYSFANDPDTGIFRPDVNVLRIVTNGAIGFSIDATQQLICCPDQSIRFTSGARIYANDGVNDSLVLNGAGTGALYLNLDQGTGSVYIGNGAGGVSGTRLFPSGNVTIGATLTVSTIANGGSGISIPSDALGIGRAPTTLLDVYGSGTVRATIESSNGQAGIEIDNDTDYWINYMPAGSNQLRWFDGVDRVIIDGTTGRFSCGPNPSTAPSGALHVKDNSATPWMVFQRGFDTATPQIRFHDSADALLWAMYVSPVATDSDLHFFDTTGDRVVFLDGGGIDNKGYGITNVASLANGGSDILVNSPIDMQFNSISLSDNTAIIMGTGNDATIRYNGTNLQLNPAALGTGAVECLGRLRLPYLSAVPSGVANGDMWMESDGLHIYYAGAEKVVAGV